MEQNFANMQQNFQKEICILKDIITEKDSKINKLEETLEAQRTTREKANERLLQLEVLDRRHNLILHGLPKEKRGDSLEMKVRSLDIDGVLIEGPCEVKNCLASYFASVGEKTVKGLGGSAISLAQDQHLKFMGPPCLKSIVIELVLE
ncbi:hypothetical protein QYM36_017268 [Artemia franciscana]|uniref:Uncharacterized protein n=1 Tax=Artemia franciscana TaxID=6661 RepID=A0AA88H5A3_ARTSF|nr:hypothetical protein QYM36_017268 [Artemia franciscana]